MTLFSELGLDPALLKALEAEGYTTPTPIQTQAIPSLLAGKDLLGIAQTGTGKTAAFALPILHRLAADRKPAPRGGARALILSPTRELASQIAESFKTYGRHMGFTVTTVYGGVGYKPQTTALQRGVDILVATPGRLIDHMTERTANLGSTEILVLDEADQMMDLGFIRPLRQIISKLPARRQTMFFSATMPHEIGALAAELLRDPVKVAVTPIAKTADRVEQKIIFIETQKKRSLLVELFADPAMTRALVFTRTKRGADKVARHLEGAGIAVAAIHGNKSQGQREAALAQFKANKIRALIATDIAARGIDVDAISHVVNYELPNVPESYVHRIGRTARAGAEGVAISLCDGEERAYLKDIERLTRQTIQSVDRRGDTTIAVPSEDRGGNARSDSDDRRGSGGNRNGRGGSRDNGGRSRFERSSRSSERGASGNGHSHRSDRKRDHDDQRPQHAGQAERPHHAGGVSSTHHAGGVSSTHHAGGVSSTHHAGGVSSTHHAGGVSSTHHAGGVSSTHHAGGVSSTRRDARPPAPRAEGRGRDAGNHEARRSKSPRSAEHRHPAGRQGEHPRRDREHAGGPSHNHRTAGASSPRNAGVSPTRRGDDHRTPDSGADNGGLRNVAFLAGGRRENSGGAKPHSGPRPEGHGPDRRRGPAPQSRARGPQRHRAD